MTTDADNDNGNGKVTTAKLGVKLDIVIDQQSKLIEKIERHIEQSYTRDNRITSLEVNMGSVCKAIDEQAEKLDEVRVKTNLFAGMNSALAVIAGVIAGIFGGSK